MSTKYSLTSSPSPLLDAFSVISTPTRRDKAGSLNFHQHSKDTATIFLYSADACSAHQHCRGCSHCTLRYTRLQNLPRVCGRTQPLDSLSSVQSISSSEDPIGEDTADGRRGSVSTSESQDSAFLSDWTTENRSRNRFQLSDPFRLADSRAGNPGVKVHHPRTSSLPAAEAFVCPFGGKVEKEEQSLHYIEPYSLSVPATPLHAKEEAIMYNLTYGARHDPRPTIQYCEPQIQRHVYENMPDSGRTSVEYCVIPDLLDTVPNTSTIPPKLPNRTAEMAHSPVDHGCFPIPHVHRRCDRGGLPIIPESRWSFLSNWISYGKKRFLGKSSRVCPTSSSTPMPRPETSMTNCGSPLPSCSVNGPGCPDAVSGQCTCYLDPVKLISTADVLIERKVPCYENMVFQLLDEQCGKQTDPYAISHVQFGLPGADGYAIPNSMQVNPSKRNTLNLTIDTERIKSYGDLECYSPAKRASSQLPPDFVINTPVVKQLKDLGFTYSKESANNSSQKKCLVTAIIVLVCIILLILVANAIATPLLVKQAANIMASSFNGNSTHSMKLVLPADRHETKSTTGSSRSTTSVGILSLTTFSQFIPTKSNPPTTTTTSTARSGLPQFRWSSTPTKSGHSDLWSTRRTYPSSRPVSSDWTSTTSSSSTTSMELTHVDTSVLTTVPVPIGVTSPTHGNFSCGKLQFKCPSGVSRIPCLWEWERCDGIRDCSDGSDEIACTARRCNGNFECTNLECISLSKACNGISDCTDGSDEINCDTFKCKTFEQQCPSGYCIPKEWVCDGEMDCPDHSDEFVCSKNCSTSEFMCPEGWCIPNAWKCNGIADCSAGQDEAPDLCETSKCTSNEFQCSTGECVTMSMVCDGYEACPDASDETGCVSVDDNSNILTAREQADGMPYVVCGDYWNTGLSNVVCRELGYEKAIQYELQSFESIPQSDYVFMTGKLLPGYHVPRIHTIMSLRLATQCRSRFFVTLQCQNFECGAKPPVSTSMPTIQRRRQKRVVGGSEATYDDLPGMAVLYHTRKNLACTATILAPWWVLTSALCIRRTDSSVLDWKLVAGTAKPLDAKWHFSPQGIIEVDSLGSAVFRDVARFVQHPGYKFKVLTADYDAMLVQLERPLSLDDVDARNDVIQTTGQVGDVTVTSPSPQFNPRLLTMPPNATTVPEGMGKPFEIREVISVDRMEGNAGLATRISDDKWVFNRQPERGEDQLDDQTPSPLLVRAVRSPVEISVTAACLTSTRLSKSGARECYTAGWGYSVPGGYNVNKVLHKIEMEPVDTQKCNSSEHYNGLVTDRMLCSWSKAHLFTGPCFNDEGAPLMCRDGTTGKFELMGLLTTHNCGSSVAHPAIFADVMVIRDWIRSVIGESVR